LLYSANIQLTKRPLDDNGLMPLWACR